MALVATLVACGGLGFGAVQPRNGIRVEPLEADLRACVPSGSPKETAETWFDMHGIRYGPITQGASGKHVGYSAIVPNDSWLESAEIRIAVDFDDDGRVTDVNIYRFVYSL
jgi:hypothetical protein